jgi:glucose/arabinose dehydrogenase
MKMNSSTRVIIFFIVVALAGGAIYLLKDTVFKGVLAPLPTQENNGLSLETLKIPAGGSKDRTKYFDTVATKLNIPWEIGFLPNGDMLVTERPGNLLRINKSGKKVIKLKNVAQKGEGGLLGMVVHPDFAENNRIYLYVTSAAANPINRVISYKLLDDKLSDPIVIVDNIPGADVHDGGRMALGPDNYLYITTGDAGIKDNAQNLGSLSGKILRVDPNGNVPEDNPFKGSPVYSYGHRNPQGITWSGGGALWSTEHGRSIPQLGFDEINMIFKSSNYGWPVIEGDKTRADMKNPILHSGPSVSWAPGSAQYYKGSIFFGGLKGRGLYEAVLNKEENKVEKMIVHFKGEFGRIRTVHLGPDGYFYITTSNRDGLGKPMDGDDKIFKVNPVLFEK